MTIAVCKADCSLEDIERMSMLIIRRCENLKPFLPAFYQVLDPARIPSAGDLGEVLSMSLLCRIRAASQALNGIYAFYHSAEPFGAESEIWQRAWLWVQFLHTFYDHLGLAKVMSQWKLCTAFLKFSRETMRVIQNVALVRGTPGFFVMAVHTWALILDDETEDRVLHLLALFQFIGYDVSPTQLEEMIVGAGGNLDGLVQLLAKHITVLAPTSTTPITIQSYVLLDGIAGMMPNILYSLSPEDTLTHPPSIVALFVRRRMVKILTVALHAVTAAKPPHKPNFAMKALNVLEVLITSAGTHALCSAIRHGMLGLIVQCGQTTLTKDLASELKRFLLVVLAPSAVLYTALIHMAASLSDLISLTSTATFKACKIYEEWCVFAYAVYRCVDVLRLFCARTVSLRACDDMACAEIGEKATFKRCSGCRTLLYCSAECQMRDWHEGGHRKTCAGYADLHRDLRQTFNAIDLRFLRFLVHHDYIEARASTHYHCARLMISEPTSSAPVAVFNYLGATPNLYMVVQRDDEANIQDDDPVWDDKVARAQRSGGLMTLHVVCVRVGPRNFGLVVPLRTNSTFLPDEAAEILGPNPDSWSDDDVEKFETEFIKLDVPQDMLEVHC
ncbi:hypothetical protein GGX14DRAFT_569714 [Mycena pura]|uniref:phytol kinase n=1 Tax=Mycena pura TaxID=153505 RepID=A0AAD6V6G1_9AGAR|nr:hypothetical protein GGX14DRAFT_569714 [Mycena pura]